MLTFLWAPRYVQPVEPSGERLICSPLQIRRLLGELTRADRLLSVQAADGTALGSGVLQIESACRLALLLQPGEGGSDLPLPTTVDIIASAELGMLLFTLRLLAPSAGNRWSCDWPQGLIHVQSRRHARISALAGTKHQATLELPGTGATARLRDVSEAGVGFVISDACGPVETRFANATLTLDGDRITVPWVQVVYSRTRGLDGYCAVGAQLLNLRAEDLGRLRRWIDAVQAALAGQPSPAAA